MICRTSALAPMLSTPAATVPGSRHRPNSAAHALYGASHTVTFRRGLAGASCFAKQKPSPAPRQFAPARTAARPPRRAFRRRRAPLPRQARPAQRRAHGLPCGAAAAPRARYAFRTRKVAGRGVGWGGVGEREKRSCPPLFSLLVLAPPPTAPGPAPLALLDAACLQHFYCMPALPALRHGRVHGHCIRPAAPPARPRAGPPLRRRRLCSAPQPANRTARSCGRAPAARGTPPPARAPRPRPPLLPRRSRRPPGPSPPRRTPSGTFPSRLPPCACPGRPAAPTTGPRR